MSCPKLAIVCLVEAALHALVCSSPKTFREVSGIERSEWTGVPTITLENEGLVVGEKSLCVALTGNKSTVFFSSRRASGATAS